MTGVVVITGSTKGLGRGLALAFADLGWKVVVSGRNSAEADALAAQIFADGGEALGLACDVSRRAQVDALREAAIAAFGGLDIWINNAGLARNTRPILEIEQDDVEAMATTNLIGQINGSRAAAEHFSAQAEGRIFNILGGGSDGEYFPGMGIYGATKRGLDYFTDALAKELADTGVIVAKVRPGMVVTDAVIREARDDPEAFNRHRKTMNVLVDQVETVAPWLAGEMLATTKTGTKIRWLTGGKIAWRMMKARFSQRPDQFERFGL